LLLVDAWDDRGFVLDRGDGKPIHPDTYSQRFDRLSERLGLRVRLHDLRHGFATALLEAGVPVKVVSEALGHSSAAFTMDVYQHVLPSMQERAAEAIEATLGSIIGVAPE
jgi:integrase